MVSGTGIIYQGSSLTLTKPLCFHSPSFVEADYFTMPLWTTCLLSAFPLNVRLARALCHVSAFIACSRHTTMLIVGDSSYEMSRAVRIYPWQPSYSTSRSSTIRPTMPIFLERYLNSVPASVLRFARSNTSLYEPTHYKYDASLEASVKECLDRFEERSRLERPHFANAHYSLGVHSAENLRLLLQNPTLADHHNTFRRFEVLQDACAIAGWRALQAHMKNEESARLLTMVAQIKQSYVDAYKEFEFYRKVFLVYTSVVVCERWGLDRLRTSIMNGSHPRLTSTEFLEFRFVTDFLRDQLRRSVICYAWMRGMCARVLSIMTWWEQQRLMKTVQWDRKFDAAVTLRQYARDLRRRYDELEGDGISLRWVAEVNDMAFGWERSRI